MKITLLKRLLLFGAFICFSALSAQTVSGTVSDISGPLPGASVVVKGTTNGTQTDFDGNYSIDNVDPSATLTISYIGYSTKEIAVDGQETINATLEEDASKLDEVVVVGYGTQKRANVTGAISKIGGAEVAGIQATRVDEALAGKLAGVLIQSQSGEPGADPRIQIRAASSLSGDASPLIVVDGYPISGSLATVNPNDIQSLEVLKDASSAAIYGSRGANGVVLVTTKKGRAGTPATFSYDTYFSTSDRYIKNLDQLKTASEWARDLQTDAYDLSEVDPGLVDYRINALANAPDVRSIEDYVFKNGSQQSHNFSVSGGSEDLRGFASLGYQNTDGVVQRQNFERLNARLTVDAKIGERIETGVSFNGFHSTQSILPHDQRDLLRAYSISPIFHTDASIAFAQQLDGQRQALFNSTGGANIPGAFANTFDQGYRGTGNINSSIFTLQPGDIFHDWHYGREQNGIGGTGDSGPAAKLDFANRTAREYFGNVSSYFQIEVVDGLKLKTVLGGDFRSTRNYFYQGTLADSRERSNQSDLDISNINRSSWLSETTLSYTKVIGKSDISAVAGFEFQNNYTRGISSVGTNVPIGLPLNYDQFDPADVISQERDETISRRSVFGRVQYAFDDRYLIVASVRRDGDSRFGVNERYATFPAVSVGWNLHNESFLKDSEKISQFKLRFSRGSLGTTAFLGPYDALSILNTAPTAFGSGFLLPDNPANPDLTWQTNTETNYGVDLGLFNNRFSLGVDYYTSDIEDMLLNRSISEVFGQPSVLANLGNITSSGWEFLLNANLVQTSDFNWSISANLSTVDQEITDLGGLDELPRVVYGGPAGRGPEFRNRVGGELGEMWGYAVTGQVESIHIEDPTRNIGFSSSEWYVVDQNGDNEITPEGDFVKLGSATPDFYYGLSSNLSYKNLDMSFQFQGSEGAEVYNIDPIYFESQFGGRLRDSFDANEDGIRDATGQFYEETRNAHGSGIQDASYLALRNLTIGYTFDSDITSKVGLNSLRIYGAATNLLYISSDSYTSFNPEGVEITNGGYLGPITYGYQEGASPIVRSFTLGLNLNF